VFIDIKNKKQNEKLYFLIVLFFIFLSLPAWTEMAYLSQKLIILCYEDSGKVMIIS